LVLVALLVLENQQILVLVSVLQSVVCPSLVAVMVVMQPIAEHLEVVVLAEVVVEE